jgi:hypothetical protein
MAPLTLCEQDMNVNGAMAYLSRVPGYRLECAELIIGRKLWYPILLPP